MSVKNKSIFPKRKKKFITKNGETSKAIISNINNANILIREEDSGVTTIIINDKMMFVVNGAFDNKFEMEKTEEGFKIKENQQDVYYKVPEAGSWYIHREDGPAIINEDYEQYHWYYEGKPLKGLLNKKQATKEEYSLYVLQEFGKGE